MNPPELANLSEDDAEEIKDNNDPVVFFTKASDIYAFAMLMIEVFTGKIPFNNKKNDSSVIFSVLGGKRPEMPSFLEKNECLEALVKRCWDQDPSKRPNANEVYTDLEYSGLAQADYTSIFTRVFGFIRHWIPMSAWSGSSELS